MMAFAVYLSIQRGHDGIVGLHAASGSAQKWYEDLNEVYEGKLVTGPMQNVTGFYDRSRSLPYYETRSEGALMLLEEYRHG